jgi:hypothetical protein
MPYMKESYKQKFTLTSSNFLTVITKWQQNAHFCDFLMIALHSIKFFCIIISDSHFHVLKSDMLHCMSLNILDWVYNSLFKLILEEQNSLSKALSFIKYLRRSRFENLQCFPLRVYAISFWHDYNYPKSTNHVFLANSERRELQLLSYQTAVIWIFISYFSIVLLSSSMNSF